MSELFCLLHQIVCLVLDIVFHCLQSLYDCENVLGEDDEAIWKNVNPPATASCINKFHDDFLTSMSDDLHTPVVLAAMSDPLKTINDLIHTRKVLLLQWSNLTLAQDLP